MWNAIAMRVLVVYAHPCPESFVAAVRDAVLRGLAKAGHTVDLVDLYGEGFAPVLSSDERRSYHTRGANEAAVADHLARLKACDALVLVYPTWWYGPPAILKGWFDRVWVPYATFELPAGNRPISRVLTNIRVLAAVTTLGSPWWWWLWLGQPGRRMLLDGIKPLLHPAVHTHWLALHRMDTTDAAARSRFLRRVEQRFAALSV